MFTACLYLGNVDGELTAGLGDILVVISTNITGKERVASFLSFSINKNPANLERNSSHSTWEHGHYVHYSVSDRCCLQSNV